MVPFYGSSVKQNMLGTGVASIGTNGSEVKVGNNNETPFKSRLNILQALLQHIDTKEK